MLSISGFLALIFLLPFALAQSITTPITTATAPSQLSVIACPVCTMVCPNSQSPPTDVDCGSGGDNCANCVSREFFIASTSASAESPGETLCAQFAINVNVILNTLCPFSSFPTTSQMNPLNALTASETLSSSNIPPTSTGSTTSLIPVGATDTGSPIRCES
jgi:hypothetical protein